MKRAFFEMMEAILITAVIILVIVGICYGLRSLEKKSDEKIYNNGICTECGGHYEYEQAVGHREDTTYIYKCNKCNKRIEVHYIVDK